MKLWKNRFVGVDISSAKIKVAQLKSNKGSLVIQNLAQTANNTPLSSMGVEELAELLKNLLNKFSLKNCICMASLPAEELILKILPAVPIMDKKELETAMHFEAATMVSGEAEEWVIRHVPLYTDVESMAVLLVAAPRHLTILLYEAFKTAGIRLLGIDIQIFALWRVSKWLDTTTCTAVLNVEDNNGQLIVVNDGYIKFARILPVNNDNITSELSHSLELYNFQSSFPVQQLFITGEEKYTPNLDVGFPVKKGVLTEELFQQRQEEPHQLTTYSTAIGLAMGVQLNV